MAEIGTDIERAAAHINAGELVAFGTETVYGLGADATDPSAVASVFAAKARPHFDPLIAHISGRDQVGQAASMWSSAAETLARRFWPGPLTIVAPKSDSISDLATSGLDTTGIRVPGHPMTQEFLAEVGRPVVAPSANRFGEVSPTTAAHVEERLGDRIAYILDTGPCAVGIESTVVRIDADDGVTVLRPGGVTIEEISELGLSIAIAEDGDKGEMLSPDSPGQLPKHYSPGVGMTLNAKPAAYRSRACESDGLLWFGGARPDWPGPVELLSENADCVEAATNLFAGLRDLVRRGCDHIYVSSIPERGLGIAINDRLRRAAQK